MAKVPHSNAIFPSFSWNKQKTTILWVDHRQELYMHNKLPGIELQCEIRPVYIKYYIMIVETQTPFYFSLKLKTTILLTSGNDF